MNFRNTNSTLEKKKRQKINLLYIVLNVFKVNNPANIYLLKVNTKEALDETVSIVDFEQVNVCCKRYQNDVKGMPQKMLGLPV